MKARTILETDLLYLVRARARDARDNGDSSRIILEIYPPKDGRHIRWRLGWDCEPNPRLPGEEEKESLISEVPFANVTPKHLCN